MGLRTVSGLWKTGLAGLGFKVPLGSIVVPFWGVMLQDSKSKPQKGTSVEPMGRDLSLGCVVCSPGVSRKILHPPCTRLLQLLAPETPDLKP